MFYINVKTFKNIKLTNFIKHIINFIHASFFSKKRFDKF